MSKSSPGQSQKPLAQQLVEDQSRLQEYLVWSAAPEIQKRMAWQWRTMKWLLTHLPDDRFDALIRGYWNREPAAIEKFEHYAKLAKYDADRKRAADGQTEGGRKAQYSATPPRVRLDGARATIKSPASRAARGSSS